MPYKASTDEVIVKHGEPFSLGDDDVVLETTPHHMLDGTMIIRILRKEAIPPA